MGKSDIISGTILEFKVPPNFGYAYCKILDFRSIRAFDGVIVKVFDHIVKEPVKEINILRERDMLFGSRRMPWLPGTRGKGAWKMKGILISENDYVIPQFKYCIGDSPFLEERSLVGPWDVVKNINEYIPCAYENVKHLEDTVVSPRPAIEIRTAMEYCRINKIEISKYFDLTEAINKIIYYQMITVPIFNTIPIELREKAGGNC